jgi:hypothetical protein
MLGIIAGPAIVALPITRITLTDSPTASTFQKT